MIFNELEEYIAKSEAITQYPEALNKIDELQSIIDKQEKMITRLDKEVTEYKAIRLRYNQVDYNLEEFSQLVIDESKKYVNRIFNIKVKEAVQRRLPQEIDKKLDQILELQPYERPPKLESLIDRIVDKKIDEILGARDRWPQWFNEYYLNEVSAQVNQEIDNEFNRRVEEQAQIRLRELVLVEWPKYLNNTINPFITQNLQQQLRRFKGEFQVKCDLCGDLYAFKLDESDITDLFVKRNITVNCNNPSCRGLFGGPHGINVTFDSIIKQIMVTPVKWVPLEKEK